jgi:hypothetical protein
LAFGFGFCFVAGGFAFACACALITCDTLAAVVLNLSAALTSFVARPCSFVAACVARSAAAEAFAKANLALSMRTLGDSPGLRCTSDATRGVRGGALMEDRDITCAGGNEAMARVSID